MVIRTLACYVRPACLVLVTLALATSPMRAATDVTITVAQGGVGVEGAFVALIGTGATKFAAVTDANGRAVFAQVPDGSYIAYASAPGASAGSTAVVTPAENAKTIAVNGSGTVFSPLDVFGAQVREIVADGKSGVFYAGTGVVPQIYRTADYGGMWAPVTISSDDKTFGLDGASIVRSLITSGFPGEVAALTDSRVYYSQDFGVTWSFVPLPLSGGNGSRIYWTHPSSSGALSMLFYGPAVTPAMYFAAMPTATNLTSPTGFTAMAISYRATVNDPVAVANGSDAGIVAVGATTSSGSPSRTAGDVKLYQVTSTPDANTAKTATFNNGNTPGVVPTIATDGTTPLAPADMAAIRLGGKGGYFFSDFSAGGPHTLLVYSVNSTDSAAGASMTNCQLGAIRTFCFSTLSTTFLDQGDQPVGGTFVAGTSGPACGATRAAAVSATVAPSFAEVATLGSCLLSLNRPTTLEVRQVNGIASGRAIVFDAGLDSAALSNVGMASDGTRGPIKSARSGLNSAEGLNRPYFPPFPAYASAGTGGATGGLSINGLTAGNVADVTFNPSSGGQLAGIMSATSGGRVVGSVDAGKSWFDIHGQGGASLGWWNAGGGSQWLLAGIGDGTNLLSGTTLTGPAPFGPSTALQSVAGTRATDLGLTGASEAFVAAIEPIAGTSMAVVAAARGSAAFYSEGSVSVVTMSSGPSAAVSPVSNGSFAQVAPISMAYCGMGSAASVADKTFVALAGSSFRGPTGGLVAISNTSQSSRSVQTISGPALTRVVRADCATGTVWTGQTGRFSGFGGGLQKSTDGGATFSAVKIPTGANDAVGAIAIDPRAPSHVVVVGGFRNDVVETKDGGFTWTVLNDSSTASCPATVTGPCGRAGTTNTIEFAPRVSSPGSLSTALRASDRVTNDLAVAATTAGMQTVTTRIVQRGFLTFGGVVGGTGVTITGGQAVNLSFAASGVSWTTTSDQPFVVVSPSSGTGSGSFVVSINNTSGTSLQPGTYNATITVRTTGALVSTQTIPVAFVVTATSMAPFGVVDTPVDGVSGVQGSLAINGWALDDIDVDRVELWRDVAPGETTPPVTMQNPADPRNGKIFIANATFVEGARPDVEVQYGGSPRAYRAGWGYLMLTWGLWNQGNGPFTLYGFAFDKEGNVTNLGTRTISVNNNAANKPFGSVDTPGIGATVSGTVANFGWGLTPKVNGVATCKIQSNGVQVSIDSGPLQPVVYGTVRSDIAGAFAGFSNSDAAGGHYVIDTRLYANGPHTIGWLITDDCNRADGVGSRFFNIQNGSSSVTSASRVAGPGVQMRAAEQVPDSEDAVTVAHGYGELPEIVAPDATGLRMARVRQDDRIEVRLPRGYERVYQLMNGVERPIPIGSSFDAASTTFYWQPAPGFLGSYELVFVRGAEQVRVRVFVDAARNR